MILMQIVPFQPEQLLDIIISFGGLHIYGFGIFLIVRRMRN